MSDKREITLTEHALQRIKERSQLSPEIIIDLINGGAAHEAHRQNGVSYFVLWSTRDKRPFLAIVENGQVISFYYTYELHRRKDGCVILPIHIVLAKKAIADFFKKQKSPKYHVSVTWEEFADNGLKRVRNKKLFACSQFELDSFKGPLLAFIGQKPEVVEILSGINITKGCTATIVASKSDGQMVVSADLSP